MINHKSGGGFVCTVALAAVLVLAGCSRQQSDWQKTRETNTADAYEQFLKKYPSGEFTAQAQARVKELYEERDWQKARDADTPEAYQAFLKQYPEGKWTEEARIRVENFTLAQAPSGPGTSPGPGASSGPPVPVADAGAPRVGDPAVGDATENAAKSPPATAAQPTSKPVAQAKTKTKSGAGTAADTGTGPYGVQLGAFQSGSKAANERWAHLQKEYPNLLAGLSSKVVPKKTGSGHLYRLQAMGLTEKRARELCTALKAKSQACVLVRPASG